MNDIMISHLVELQKSLEKENVEFILGGGMSLYLRQIYLKTNPSSRYPFNTELRSTDDLDIFLSSSVIVDFEKINKLKSVLGELNYKPSEDALYFQFIKEVKIYDDYHKIKIDLLSSPPKVGEKSLVHIKFPRIRPKKSKKIHAYLTEEAINIDLGKVPVILSKYNKVKVFLPSAYNYLILKLYAFNDRKDKTDIKSDRGKHHAFDIFSTVTGMNENDWENARFHYSQDNKLDYLKKACQIRQACFNDTNSIGVLRIKESKNYRSQRELFDKYLDIFMADLSDLFPTL